MKTLKINQNWSIESDGNNCTLTFAEKRIRKDGKNKGEEYLFEETYHYPTIYTAWKSYLNKATEDAKDVKDAVRIIEETYKKIEKLTCNK